MRNFPVASLSVALLAMLALVTYPTKAIPAVTRQGKYLYQGDDRFYIKGLAYQESAPTAASTQSNQDNGGFPEPDSFADPLALPDACTRDVTNFQDLGINTIRVYSVNSSLDHDSCMSTFSDAGIYVIIDLALPLNGSINRAAPTWDTGLLNLYASTIDAFSGYDNLLAVNVANEVVTQPSNTVAAPFVKAAVRDVKSYLKSINKDNILVSYSSTDGEAGENNWRDLLANYLTCGSEETSVDLYGLNSYSWCGDSSYTASGYDQLTEEFGELPVPVYLSEFGCVDNVGTGERPWTEVSALYSSPMTDTFSGGVAFSYFPMDTGTDYGLVSVSGDEVTKRDDWDALKREFANTTAPTAAPADSSSSPDYARCRGNTENFPASTDLPPTPSPQLCRCMRNNALTCLLTPQAQNSPNVIGVLTTDACSYLGERGGSCAPIVANGDTGTYGNYSSCDAADRLEWAMSQYYEITDFNALSCDFAGNASLQLPPTTSSQIDSAFSSCLAQFPIGVSTPTPITSDVKPASTSSKSSTANGSNATGTGPNAATAGLPSSSTLVYAVALSVLVSLCTLVGTLSIL